MSGLRYRLSPCAARSLATVRLSADSPLGMTGTGGDRPVSGLRYRLSPCAARSLATVRLPADSPLGMTGTGEIDR